MDSKNDHCEKVYFFEIDLLGFSTVWLKYDTSSVKNEGTSDGSNTILFLNI